MWFLLKSLKLLLLLLFTVVNKELLFNKSSVSEDIIFSITFSYKTGFELNGIMSLDSKYESPICSHSLFDDFNMYSLLKVIFCSSK